MATAPAGKLKVENYNGLSMAELEKGVAQIRNNMSSDDSNPLGCKTTTYAYDK